MNIAAVQASPSIFKLFTATIMVAILAGCASQPATTSAALASAARPVASASTDPFNQIGQSRIKSSLAPAEIDGNLPRSVSAPLVAAGVTGQQFGIYVREVGAKQPVLSLNPAQPFVPASTMKVLTTGVSLNALGPAYRWQTGLLTDGRQTGSVLNGNLYLAGAGDPKLTMENVWLLLRQLRARGIDRIQGDVVIDSSRFVTGPFDAAAFDGAPLKPYNAGPDAALFNFAALTVTFSPDAGNGSVKVWADPAMGRGVQIVPPALSGGACGAFPGNISPVYSGNTLTFQGKYPASCGNRSWTFHAAGIPAYRFFGAALDGIWSELGGSIDGQIISGSTPTAATELTSWRSAALIDVIRDINKNSNNVMARQLLLTLGAEAGGVPASVGFGAEAIGDWLRAHNVDTTGLVIENGSGLARSARITPMQLAQALTLFYQSPYGSEFVSSLPIVGIDGTMARRLTKSPARGSAHIKTGTLRNATGIAGYVQAASGRQYVVVMIVNHGNTGAGREAQDALLEWIYEKG